MNERIGNNKIYLLAKEAGLIEFEQLDFNPALGSPTYESVAKTRKFAALLIKECLEQVCDEVQYKCDWEMANDVSKRVIEHFGVEV